MTELVGVTASVALTIYNVGSVAYPMCAVTI
jgi:hypothetical protein